jgi:hypothetical protein
MGKMNKKIEQAWAALKTLPEPEQERAAEAILDYTRDRRQLTLTPEQMAEVKQRLADPQPKFLTLEEVRARFARRSA